MASAAEVGKQIVARTPEVAGGVLRSIIEFAIDGHQTFPGAKATAGRHLEAHGDREAAIDALVGQHIGLASAQGFLTSVGGLITMPVGVPANIAGLAAIDVRMIAAIAHLRGYDIDDRRVRSAITLALLGEDDVRRLVSENKLPSTPLVVATAPVHDPRLEAAISERVMGSLAARIGDKHAAVIIVRRIPLVGGGVGAAMDGWITHALGGYARKEFIDRRRRVIPA